MAVIHTDTVAVENVSYGLADALYAVASKYTNRFSHEAGSNIITFDGCQVYFDNRNIGVKNGDEIAYNIRTAYDGCYYSPISVITLFTNNVFLFYFHWTWSSDNCACVFMFISKGSNKLLGVTTNNSYRDVENNMTYMDLVSCNDTTYKPQRLFYTEASQYGYELIPSNVLIEDKVIFSNSNGDYFIIDDLKSCSYMPLHGTYTINGKNYWAIGYYTLIQVET